MKGTEGEKTYVKFWNDENQVFIFEMQQRAM